MRQARQDAPPRADIMEYCIRKIKFGGDMDLHTRVSGASNGELVGPRTLSRPIFAPACTVRPSRPGLRWPGPACPPPPLPPRGGRVSIGGALSHGRSRSPHRRHGVKLATSTYRAGCWMHRSGGYRPPLGEQLHVVSPLDPALEFVSFL